MSINSPGGAAAQSHLIHRRIRALADEKKLPVIAFVEDVAASGGYMIACAADEIVADASSIVGSIGVVGGSFGFDKLIEKIGVERRLYTSGENKAMLDPFLPEKPEDVERLKALQREIHESFIALVKERRGAKLDSRETALFSGAYWTGQRGRELGLVDAVGDLRTVLRERYGDKVRTPLIAERGLLVRPAGAGCEPALGAAGERAEPRRRHGCDARGARIMVALRTVGESQCLCSPVVLGAIGAVVLIKLFNREWQRVNDELDRANPVRVNDPERAGVPTLRQDPATGEYRPQTLSVSPAP